MISVFGSMVGTEEIRNLKSCINSQWIGFGNKVIEFEKKFSTKFNIKNFAMVDNGSNALFLAVKLLNLPKNSEIILPSFTWVSCAQSILMAGHKPIFCDVELDTMNVSKNKIIEKITRKTKAIMVVHYAGLPVDMDEIISLGYPVIEDAAHAVCSKYKGKQCGTIGTVGIFSFDAVKNLTTSEGGGISVQNKAMLNRIKKMRYCGIGKSGFENSSSKKNWWQYDISEPFIKMLPSNITASIGLAQLNKIDYLQSRRKEIWDFYQNELKKIKQIELPVNVNGKSKHSYFTYCLKVKKRNELAKYLLKNKIYTTLRYHPLHMNKLYRQSKKVLKNTEILNKQALSIPLHPRLKNSEVEFVIKKIKNFYL
jgi:dTDP-4-amino-4,6-dideoxygalactose transaminase